MLDDLKIKRSVLSSLMLEGFETSETAIDYLICGEDDPLGQAEENPNLRGIIVLYRNRGYISREQHFSLSKKFGARYVPLRCPYLLSELCAAADAVSADGEQSEAGQADGIPDGNVIFDDRVVSYRGKHAKLTEREADLFGYLLSRRGETVSRDDIRRNVWEKAGVADTNVTDVYVSYLRRKLKPLFGDGAIVSVRGKGYILSV